MALPTIKDVRPVNPVLTNLSFGFANKGFLWDKIAPFAKQDQKSGTYFIYTRDYWFRRMKGAARASAGLYTRIGFGLDSSTYDCQEIGFEVPLDDPTVAASQTPEDLQTKAVAFLTNVMQIELEKLVAAAAFVTGVWGTTTSLSSTTQWSDFDNSDPIANAKTAKRAILRNTGAEPNTLFVGATAWDKLMEHPLIVEKYKYTQKGVMTPDLVAAVLDVKEIVVGDSIENTAAEKTPGTASFTGADIWTDNALFLVRNNPGLGVANGAYTFIWDEKGNVPWAVEDYRDEPIRSTITRIFTHQQVKVVSSQHGYIYLDCVA